VFCYNSFSRFYFLLQRQVRRVYEVLRLKATDVSNKEEYTQYRLDVKRRLNIPFQVNRCCVCNVLFIEVLI